MIGKGRARGREREEEWGEREGRGKGREAREGKGKGEGREGRARGYAMIDAKKMKYVIMSSCSNVLEKNKLYHTVYSIKVKVE